MNLHAFGTAIRDGTMMPLMKKEISSHLEDI